MSYSSYGFGILELSSKEHSSTEETITRNFYLKRVAENEEKQYKTLVALYMEYDLTSMGNAARNTDSLFSPP